MKHIKKLARRTANRSVEQIIQKKKAVLKPNKKVIIQKLPNNIKNPKINIITRTSGRPNSFKRCHESIKNQNYKNIRHIVSIDDLNDKEYVEKYDVDYYFIDKEKIKSMPDIPDPQTGKRFIYNLYFNELFSKVDEGWILILDDDDYLADNQAIQKMVNKLHNNTDMLIFQMQYPHGAKLPTVAEINRPPRLGRIGSPCILVHSGIAKTIKWDGWKCGDFRYINQVYKKTGAKRWITEALIKLGGAGFGLKKDIEKPHALNTSNGKQHNHKILEHFNRKFKDQKILSQSITKVNSNDDTKSKKYYDFVIIIPTYKRYNSLNNILNDLYSQPNRFTYKIIVLDDNSLNKKQINALQSKYNDLTLLKNKINNGKKRYWKTVNKLLNKASLYNFRYLIQLDDDFEICANFLETITNEWNKHRNLLALNLVKHNTGKRWGYKNYVDGGGMYSYKFWKEYKFNIKPIPLSRWKYDQTLSSGVWQQVTEYLNNRYPSKIKVSSKSLINHLGINNSKMNHHRNKKKNKNAVKTDDFVQKVPIIMCTWKRLNRLPKTLSLLNKQTLKDFDLYIWNNNPEYQGEIEKILNNFDSTFNIYVNHSETNIGGIGRFYYAKNILAKGYDKVIFIDDDQEFDKNLVKQLVSEYKPKTITSWWAWKVKDQYFKRDRVKPSNKAKYCGTGGMICDISIFSSEEVFNIPSEFRFIEDLWLSYVANHILKWNMYASAAKIKIVNDGNDQYKGLIELKNKFYKDLIKKGWK